MSMEGAHQVRITKLKLSKDKLGQKWTTIELSRVVEMGDCLTTLLESSVAHMRQNDRVSQMALDERVQKRNLIFFAAAGVEKPSEALHSVELNRFRLRRDGNPAEEETTLLMSFEFTIPLEEARQWLIPAIGDDILCVVEEAQLRIPEVE